MTGERWVQKPLFPVTNYRESLPPEEDIFVGCDSCGAPNAKAWRWQLLCSDCRSEWESEWRDSRT